MTRLIVGAFGFLLAACSGSAASVDDSPAPAPAAPVTSGAKVAIHVRATAATVPHDDGLAGQTPKSERLGIRSLVLSRGASDPAPWTVFDYGSDAHEALLDDGSDTIVATVPASALHAGVFTHARVGISHVRYAVATTVHYAGGALTGELDVVEVLSKGARVDGNVRDRGWYEQTLIAGGVHTSRTGSDAPVPAVASTGGITLDTSGDVAAYEFPVSLDVPATLDRDMDVTFELNVHEDFRWQDQQRPGYAPGVWDTEATTYEPVITFGANSFRVYAQ